MKDQMQAIQGDITKLDVDAIVNAANKSLLGGGGVDGAIHRTAGPGLLEECRKLNGCETGQAKITEGYNLPAKFVIHTVGPVYSGKPEDATLLSNCYKNSLKLALQKELTTIAFPAISCGVYGYPIKEASQIAINTTLEVLKQNASSLKVYFVLFSDSDLEIYQSRIKLL
jgi:O-acetyl-ADP-ribose deacetylase (regulator of RNase III)